MLPPLEQHRFADELEPRRELELRVLEQGLQLLGRDVFRVLNLVLVDVEVNVGLDEEDVVDCLTKRQHTVVHMLLLFTMASSAVRTLMLSPLSVTRRFVVNTGQETELIERNLLLLDTKLVVEFPLRRVLDALN